jgi:hypothetical protein
MARDKIHDVFRQALELDGWFVTDDPLFLRVGKIPIHIDLGAEKILGAEREGVKIAIEVKTFGKASLITALYEAVGKFIVYRKALEVLKPERVLYLAMPEDAFNQLNREPILAKMFTDEKIKIVLYQTDSQKITSWLE